MTITSISGSTFTVEVIGYKPHSVVKAHCLTCGWYGYETCHHDTVTAHSAHLLSTHTCDVLSSAAKAA